MDVVTLQSEHADRAAAVLHDGFADHWPQAWPTIADARAEVREALAADRVGFAAVEHGRLLGWIGALESDYGPVTWELHPLVVAPSAQGRGVGRTLVTTLLDELRDRNVLTVILGTDDTDAMTTIGGRDLYPGVLDHLRAIEDRTGHPFAFYRRLGFEVVGVVPDASGPGRPDILMATRLQPR